MSSATSVIKAKEGASGFLKNGNKNINFLRKFQFIFFYQMNNIKKVVH